MEIDGGMLMAGAPNLQAGGRLFESGTAHVRLQALPTNPGGSLEA
jgi:hypothetical protein